VDDGSTDRSLERLRALADADDRVTVHALPANRGAAFARNTGLDLARGTFVTFFDADDFYPRGALRRLVRLARGSGSPVVRGSMVSRDERGVESQVEWQKMPTRWRTHLIDEPSLWIPWGFTCYLYSRRFLLEHGCRFPDLIDGEDPVFLARCLTRAESVTMTSEVTYIYSSGGSQDAPRITGRHLHDFLEHSRMIRRSLTTSGNARVWREGCGPFYFEDVQRKLDALPDPRERRRLARKAYLVWARDAGWSPRSQARLWQSLAPAGPEAAGS
jgi:glycosyltransferase involved in cell wall biosynthesis